MNPLMQSSFIVNICVACTKLRQHKMKNALLTILRTTFSCGIGPRFGGMSELCSDVFRGIVSELCSDVFR